MILPRTAIYALRALAVLKDLPPAESLSTSALSEETGVPRQYLAKVLRTLTRDGILAAHRGRNGGFRLSRPARRIPLEDVLGSVDTDLAAGQCAFREGSCNARNPCRLHGVWSRLQDAVGEWAGDTSVADLG